MIKPDIILCDIIATEMTLDPSRVVVYNQNWKPPKDEDIYVIVSFSYSQIISSTNRYNALTGQEKKSVTKADYFNVEITSKNTDAKYRKEEIIMALTSSYSEQKQEENQIKISRNNRILDLSFIDGGSSLHRYRIPVIINNMNTKNDIVEYFDKFQTPEEEIK